jgi:integrase
MLLYRYSLDAHVGNRWKQFRLREIERLDIRRLYADLRDKGLSTSALCSVRSVLSALFATAAEDGLVRRNPVSGVRIPASLDPGGQFEERAKALAESELRGLLRALPAYWRLFFKFLTQTGLRISEALGLDWQHVDLGGQPHISVRQ